MLPPMAVNNTPRVETVTRQSSGPEEADDYGDLFQPVEQPYRVISGLGVSGIKRLSERLREQGKDCD